MLQFPPAPLPIPAPAKGEYALFPGAPLLRLCNPEDEPHKGKMLKVDAVLLEQILGIVTPSFPVGECFIHKICPFTYYVNRFCFEHKNALCHPSETCFFSVFS